jgi:iron(III) transport system substrate-binding protein
MRILAAAILGLATLCSTAAPALAQGAPAMAELHRLARGEGRIAFGGALKEDAARELIRAFTQQFPGVNVNYTRRSTEPMVQLIEADRIANRVSFDLINLTEPSDLVRYKREGFLMRVTLPDPEIFLPDTIDPDGFFFSLGITPMYGIYNTRVLNAQTAPRSLRELATDPRWRGRVVISRPTRGGTGAAALMNVIEATGRDFLQNVRERDILLTRGNEAALASVISGERPVSWGVSGYRVLEARAAGSPIEIIRWDEGTAIAQFMAAIPARARNPNGAQLLLRWLLSKEGQELYVRAADFYSARSDVTITPAGEPPMSEVRLNIFSPQRVLTEGQALAQEFDRVVGLR